MPEAEPLARTADARAVARKRWKILAKALLKDERDSDPDVSVRRFTSFGILAPFPSEQNWLLYSTPDKLHFLYVRRVQRSPTAEDLIGFNNTGNVCVWPSEETLSVYVISNIDAFKAKRVLELGGGMSCMAGLIIAKYGSADKIHVTDGNVKSIENVRAIIKYNDLESAASCSVLKWENSDIDRLERYDIILVADCLFFDEVREDLVRTIGAHLADDGTAHVMAPQRGDTLDRFVNASRRLGFDCAKYERYDDVVWERHLQLLNSNTCYDPSLHYPILLKLTRSNRDASSPQMPLMS